MAGWESQMSRKIRRWDSGREIMGFPCCEEEETAQSLNKQQYVKWMETNA